VEAVIVPVSIDVHALEQRVQLIEKSFKDWSCSRGRARIGVANAQICAVVRANQRAMNGRVVAPLRRPAEQQLEKINISEREAHLWGFAEQFEGRASKPPVMLLKIYVTAEVRRTERHSFKHLLERSLSIPAVQVLHRGAGQQTVGCIATMYVIQPG